MALAATPASTAPARPIALDKLIAFANPTDCTTAPAFTRLLGSMLILRKDGRLVRGTAVVPPAYRGAIGPVSVEIVEDVHEASVALRGTWRGLKLISLHSYAVEEGDLSGFHLIFAATRAQLLAAVNRAGFRLPASGMREIGDGVTTTISVTGDRRSAIFTCNNG